MIGFVCKFPKPVWIVIALVCAVILVVSHSPAGLAIQFLLGKLTYSTSNGASLYMLVIAILGVIVLGSNRLPARLSNYAVLILPILLVTGFVLHGIASAYYLFHFDLPFGPYFLHWRDGTNSYTSPFHSHLGKAAIDYMAQWLGVSEPAAGYYDTGRVFRGILHDVLVAALAFCFILGTLAAVMALPNIRKRYPANRGLAMIYLCCAAVALKNMLDGGFLAQPASVACVTIGFLSIAQNAVQLQSFLKKYWALGCLLIGIALLPQILGSGDDPLPNLTELLVAIAIIALALKISFNSVPSLSGWLIALYLLVAIGTDAAFNLLPLLRPLNADAQVFRVDTAAAQPIQAGVNVQQLYKDLGDSAIKSRWLLLANQKTPGLSGIVYFIYPLAIIGQDGRFSVPPVFTDLAMKPIPNQRGWFVLYVRIKDGLPPAQVDGIGDVISHNNAYVYTHAIARMLTQSGFTEFIMMPGTGSNPIPSKFLANLGEQGFVPGN